MGKDYEEQMKKAVSGIKMHQISQPGIARFASYPDASHIEKLLEGSRRERQEKIQREKDTLEAISGLLELAKENPSVQQHVQTLVQNSTIHHMQNVHSGATGTQNNITNNTGIDAEDMLKLLESMRDISDVLVPDRSAEAHDLINELEQEIQKTEGKAGRIKASLTYLKSLFTEIVGNPTKVIAKTQFTEYAMEKTPDIIQGIDHLYKSISS